MTESRPCCCRCPQSSARILISSPHIHERGFIQNCKQHLTCCGTMHCSTVQYTALQYSAVQWTEFRRLRLPRSRFHEQNGINCLLWGFRKWVYINVKRNNGKSYF